MYLLAKSMSSQVTNPLVQYAGTLSENTKKAYIHDILEFFGTNNPREVTLEDIRAVDVTTANQYREKLIKQGLKLSTVNRKLTSLSGFYRFLSRREVGIMDYNPFSSREGTARIRQSKKYSNTRCLSAKEVQAMLNVLKYDNTLLGVRNKLIIMLLSTTGIRREELLTLKVGMLRKIQDRYVFEIVGKGDKELLVPVSDQTKKLMDKYLSMRGLTYEDRDEFIVVNHANNYDGQALSPQGLTKALKQIAERAGIGSEDISPHVFRHTFITQALELGAKLEDVQDMVGHASIDTTRRYDHTSRILTRSPANKLDALFMGGNSSE